LVDFILENDKFPKENIQKQAGGEKAEKCINCGVSTKGGDEYCNLCRNAAGDSDLLEKIKENPQLASRCFGLGWIVGATDAKEHSLKTIEEIFGKK
jgi:hypothetical protein